ncbi:hypothetical protein ABL78_7080 [Leptomonas seymouri]|uniref:Uncharacterized protein n=1 Tax=Leptomonas seymouri TaxID=5684 RepID=A0A0N1IHK6_LEPSE|nr:hypothetical protein ABL78_7080 [Leptomonas seymouri]|eukprot:KPI83882.1 hypothetical protein ABL78_7080 [Leptomonas seymouri]
MYAVDISPPRSAPPLQVEALTIEKNASPALSDEEKSPQQFTSAAVSESVSTSVGKAKAPLHSRTTFARTKLAATPRMPSTSTNLNQPSAASLPQPTESASPARAAPSPLHSILNFYLSASPSPRRPAEDLQSPHHAASSRGNRHREEQLPNSPPGTATSYSSLSAYSEVFHRSPALARTYLDEFLAADADDAELFNSNQTTHQHYSASSSSNGQPRTPGRHRAVGVAMDNSPVVPEMWEETSSCSSFILSASNSSTLRTEEQDAESPSSITDVAAAPYQAHESENSPIIIEPAEGSTLVSRPAPVEAVLQASPPEVVASPHLVAAPHPAVTMQDEKEQQQSGLVEKPMVERELLFPTMLKGERERALPTSPFTPRLTPSFSAWKRTLTSTETSPRNSGQCDARTVAHGSNVDSTLSAPHQLMAPPPPEAPYTRTPLPEDPDGHVGRLGAPLQTFTALSSLLRLQKIRAAAGEEGGYFVRARETSSAPASKRALSVEATSEAARPAALKRYEGCSNCSSPGATHLQSRRRPDHFYNEAQQFHYYGFQQPDEMHVDPAAAVAPVVRPPRSVVYRLYPSPTSRKASAHKRLSARGAPKNAQLESQPTETHRKDAEGPRWNVSTRIKYNPLTESIETPDDQDDKLQRSRSRGQGEYVKERPRSSPPLRSGSAPRSPAPPPPHTRTSLLRLQAMTARKAEEAVKLEEELNPSFHPVLAPKSARICREKLRELAEAAAAKDGDAGQQHCQMEDAAGAPTSAVRDTSSKRVNERAKNPLLTSSSPSLARKRSCSSEKGKLAPRDTPSATARSRVGNRLYQEAAERRERQAQLRQEYEREEDTHEFAERREPQRRFPHRQTESNEQLSATSLKAQVRLLHSQTHLSQEQPMVSTFQSQIERPHIAEHGRRKDAQPLPHSALLPVKHSDIDGSIARNPLRRIDFYSFDGATASTAETTASSEQKRSVEERLLALEEDRRRRLDLMRYHADVHAAATSGRIFQRFSGR